MNTASTAELLGGLNAVETRFAPASLHWVGREELLRRRPRIAVIGTRKPSAEGLALAASVATCVVGMGGVVVSGLALGIDRCAHEAAIEANGDTIAVLGTPVTKSYPKENAQLQARIAAEFLLVSEFRFENNTSRKSFIMRNRTMALLSHGSVIVEAGEKSGTEHQGWEAIRLGRELFISESLMQSGFEWPKKMIEYGATEFATVQSLREVLEERLPGPGVSHAAGF